MSEKTIRARLKKLGLHLIVTTERYTGAKCYAVMDGEKPVMYHVSLNDLVNAWHDDLR